MPEPLIYELLDTRLPTRIVMIGTAGVLSRDVVLRQVYVVDKAFLGGAAVDLPDRMLPLRPRFSGTRMREAGLEKTSTVSTDYYYGFSKGKGSRKLRTSDARLRRSVLSLWNHAKLVEMETAQFYHFCRVLGNSNLEYVAVRGASNYLDVPDEQICSTNEVLRKSLKSAFVLLGVSPR